MKWLRLELIFANPMHIFTGFAEVYMYLFAHRPTFSKHPDWVVSDHMDEIPYVFGEIFNPRNSEDWPVEDRSIALHMMECWANFARFGYTVVCKSSGDISEHMPHMRQ